MATYLHLVYQNYIYHIESISPTCTINTRKFRSIDPLRISSEESAGLTRRFSLAWMGGEEDDDLSSQSDRITNYTWELDIYYHVGVDGLQWDDAHTIILQDRHDIIKKLRTDSTKTGYDSTHTTTDIGLYNRLRLSDELDRSNSPWVLKQRWITTVREVEV